MQLDASILGGLRCFEAAGRLLSFTEAAHSLHLTQSAVSQQIRNLEDRLGYNLFVRQSRSLTLTPKGETLWKATSRTFQELARTLQQLGASNVPLQISCSPSFALNWLMPRLVEFNQQHDHIPLRLMAEFHSLDLRAMESGGIDVALRYDPFDYDQLRTEVILQEYLVAVATPQYLAQHPRLAASRSLDDVVVLRDSAAWAGAPELIEAEAYMKAMNLTWGGRSNGPQYNLASLTVNAALNHQGVAISRTALICEELRSGRLVNIFGNHAAAPARYIMLSRNPDDERVMLFSRWVKDACRVFESARTDILEMSVQDAPSGG